MRVLETFPKYAFLIFAQSFLLTNSAQSEDYTDQKEERLVMEICAEELLLRLVLFQTSVLRCIACRKHWDLGTGRLVCSVLFGSLLGVIGTCLFPSKVVGFLLLPVEIVLHGFLVFGIQKRRDLFLFGGTYLRFASFIAGSTFALQRILNTGTILLYCLFLLYPIVEKKASKRKEGYRVILRVGGEKFAMAAFYDSGNLLEEPVEKQPVFVLCTEDKRLLSILLDREGHPIFYAAVGGTNCMTAYRADRMTILHDGGRQTIWAPFIALGDVRGKETMMILSGLMKT